LELLSARDKQQVLRELKLRVSEEGRLYLRFDKQAAYKDGALRLTSEEEDSIQVVLVLEAFPANMVGFLKAAMSVFGQGL
jgi:RNA binding exosome subunit